MKIKKLLITFTSLATPALLTPILSSCKDNASKCTINFSASEGITLSSYSPISITKGKYWSDLIKDKNFPKVSFEGEYTELGWCKVDDQGQYELIENDFKIESNLNIKYIGYEKATHPTISVEFNYKPATEPVGLEFAAGLTFKSFKSYYNLPSEPKLTGYTFEGYYDGDNHPLTDEYLFPNTDTNVNIKWNADAHTVTLQNDGNGTVTSLSNLFTYGKTWKEIKQELSIVPVPNTGYEFYKWVDKYGDDLSDDYVMKKDFTAKALFKPIVLQDVVFTCTDNTVFDSGLTKITKKVKTGTKWGDIKDDKDIVPSPIYPSTCTKAGWYVVSQTGLLEEITNEYIISEKTNIKFVAYNPSEYLLTIRFVYGPKKEYKDLQYLKGATFGDFRAYYDIPETYSYEGYNFLGYYQGETPIDDTFTFPSDTSSLVISAEFEQIKKDIYITANEYGKIESDTKISVDYGKQWKDIKGDIVTKANDGYVLEKWVFLDGTIVEDTYEVKETINVKAIFTKSKPTFSILDNGDHTTRSQYANYQGHGDSNDVKWLETVKGYEAREGYTFNKPSINNGCVHLETNGTNKDFRFITVPIKISIPVKARSTRTFKFHVEVSHVINLKGYIISTNIQNTFELFELTNENDHPEFYANCRGNDDTKASDARSVFRNSIKDSKTTWTDESYTYKYDGNTQTYTYTNDTDDTKWFDHYYEVSLLIEGTSSNNGQQGHVVNAQFTLIDL